MAVNGSNFPDNGAVATLMDKLEETVQCVEWDQYSRARVHLDVALPHIGIDIGGRFPDNGREDHLFAGLAFGDGLEVDRICGMNPIPGLGDGVAKIDFPRVIGAPEE
jgi:hypothetical protein